MRKRAALPDIFLSLLLRSRPAALIFAFCLLALPSIAAENDDCEEVLLLLQVEHIGNVQLPSVICGEEAFLSVTGIFNFLKIYHTTTPDLSRVEGFFIDPNNEFLIDVSRHQIFYNGKTFDLKPEDVIVTRTNLFIRPGYLEEIFGLRSTFTFYSLSVVLSSKEELPSIKAARKAQMRANINKVKQEFIADTTFLQKRPFFHFGSLNWNMSLQQQPVGRDYNRFNLGLGGLLAGGEFIANLNYSSSQSFSSRNQSYRWRYVNNENRVVRQLHLGKIMPQGIASLYDPVVGVELTNASTQVRKSFGTYTLSDHTEPNWIVELYINNVLVDYVKTDASGFYSFNVPLMYGSTDLKLRLYGPWGEERVSHKYFSLPYVFLPETQLEYKISAGMVEDEANTVFARGELNYGLHRNITLGGGLEYLSSLSEGKELIPFLQSSVKLSSNLLFSGEFAQGVGYQANLNYSSASRFSLELNYSKYEEEQEAVRFSYLEERKALISIPFKIKYLSGNTRIQFRQHLMADHTYNHLEWMVSGRTFGLNFNARTYAFFTGKNEPVMYSNLATSFKLGKEVVFSPQLAYNYNRGSMSSLQGELRTQVFKKGYLGVSYNHNFEYRQDYLQLSLQYDLPFSRFGFSSSLSRNQLSFAQTAGGGLTFQPQADFIDFSTNETLDRGSIKFVPFLDLNGNGKKEQQERVLQGVNIRTTGGSLKQENADGSIVYKGLEPYVQHYFEVQTHNLQRISWKVENRTMNISLNPNHMKLVEIPVAIVGEIGGYVLLEGKDSQEGLGGVKINILQEDRLIASIVSQPDGYFSYLGLDSGSFLVQPDPEQVNKLGLKTGEAIKISIDNGEDGTLIDNLEFLLLEN